jgi:hypothetical protein
MFKLLKSYFFWTYPRGSFHYDVMVTLILLFMFVTPHFVNFKDGLVETVAKNRSEIVVKQAGHTAQSSRFLFQIRADDLGDAHSDAELRAAILQTIEPISGEVTLETYAPVRDQTNHIVAYNAWVLR